MKTSLILDGLFLGLIVYLLVPQPACAYWDATTGTYILQMLFVGMVTVWMSVKGFFRKVRSVNDREQLSAANEPKETKPDSANDGSEP